jgi:hypothetical protein
MAGVIDAESKKIVKVISSPVRRGLRCHGSAGGMSHKVGFRLLGFRDRAGG